MLLSNCIIQMSIRLRVYLLTFLTYSIIHSVRTGWSSLKPILNQQPFDFPSLFLGWLDLTVLLLLALGLNLLGWMTEKLNVKRFLLIGMILLFFFSLILSVILFSSVSRHAPYVVVYGLIGLSSCTGWPSCFYIISKYFTKKDGIVLSLWNSSSQCGDLIALLISNLIVSEKGSSSSNMAGGVILTITLLILVMMIIDYFFLKAPVNQNQVQIPPPNIQPHLEQFVQEKQVKICPPGQQKQKKQLSQNKAEDGDKNNSSKQMENNNQASQLPNTLNTKPVTFLNVWCLPSVLPLVLSFSMVKAINTIIVNWLVFYLALIGLTKQSRVTAISWSVSIVIGGVISAYLNKKLDKRYFIGALIICFILFLGLEEMHLHPNSFQVIILIILCGLIFGGPYNLLGTAVPLMLAENQQIKARKGAISTIVSVMQGCGQLLGALMMVVIPTIGPIQMHYVPAVLCLLSAVIISYQQFSKKEKLPEQKNSMNT